MERLEESTKSVTPLIKWAGGKKKLAPIIEEAAESSVNLSKVATYVEPFVGGAALFLYLTTKYHFKKQVILDVNPALINLYQQVRDNHQEVIDSLDQLEAEYNDLTEDDELESKKSYFYQSRQEFNDFLVEPLTNKTKMAALFIFLNKTDFNGLYRVNSKGLFNVPFGKKKTVKLYDLANFNNFSNLLQNTDIVLGDYHESKKYIGPDSFFYFDPPYRPLTDSASFTSYTKSSFNDADQIELAKYATEVQNGGSHFALSNSDPHQSDENDDFFDDLYSEFTIKRIQARRMISARSKGRGNVSELLITG